MIPQEKMSLLLSQSQLNESIQELGEQISKDYCGKSLLVVGILKGAVLFYSDLVRHIHDVDVRFDFMAISSYGSSTESSGEVRIRKDTDISVEGQNVLIVEDIIDTGLTIKSLLELLRTRNPASLRVCTLLDKPSRRLTDIRPDYRCFEIPDRFVVGYGLDYDQWGRYLKDIWAVKPEYVHTL